jgi:hypothetical protein
MSTTPSNDGEIRETMMLDIFSDVEDVNDCTVEPIVIQNGGGCTSLSSKMLITCMKFGSLHPFLAPKSNNNDGLSKMAVSTLTFVGFASDIISTCDSIFIVGVMCATATKQKLSSLKTLLVFIL